MATANEGTIRAWWGEWPDANIGIATGVKSRLLVLDVDNKNGKRGDITLAQLRQQYDWEPQTFSVKTASGRHYYFEYRGGGITGGTCILGDGLDVQGDGKCVITAPSVHKSMLHYERENDLPLATLPEAILSLVRSGGPSGEKRIPAGNRNDELTRIAGSARRQGLGEVEIGRILLDKNERRCTLPLPRADILRIAKSVARYDPATPNLHWMPLYMTDWFESLVVRSGKACDRGMYASLIIEAWRRQGVLPADDTQLWRLAQADSLEQFEEEKSLVLTDFVRDELQGMAVLVHPRIAELWARQSEKYIQKVEAGRQSGASRRSRAHKKWRAD